MKSRLISLSQLILLLTILFNTSSAFCKEHYFPRSLAACSFRGDALGNYVSEWGFHRDIVERPDLYKKFRFQSGIRSPKDFRTAKLACSALLNKTARLKHIAIDRSNEEVTLYIEHKENKQIIKIDFDAFINPRHFSSQLYNLQLNESSLVTIHHLIHQKKLLMTNYGSLSHYRYFNIAGRGLNGGIGLSTAGFRAPALLIAASITGVIAGGVIGAESATSEKQGPLANRITGLFGFGLGLAGGAIVGGITGTALAVGFSIYAIEKATPNPFHWMKVYRSNRQFRKAPTLTLRVSDNGKLIQSSLS